MAKCWEKCKYISKSHYNLNDPSWSARTEDFICEMDASHHHLWGQPELLMWGRVSRVLFSLISRLMGDVFKDISLQIRKNYYKSTWTSLNNISYFKKSVLELLQAPVVLISLADTPLFLSKISLYWGNYFHRPAVMSKRTPLNTEMNSIIRATAVLIFLKYFIVNRREKRFWYLCLFSKALETFFMLHISSLSADLKLRTRRQHAATTQIPAWFWTHYNREPIWVALQERTRRKREK